MPKLGLSILKTKQQGSDYLAQFLLAQTQVKEIGIDEVGSAQFNATQPNKNKRKICSAQSL